MKKTKAKMSGILAALLLFCLLCIPVSAEKGEGFAYEYPRLMDTADILSESEEQNLLAALDEISERQKMDIAVITVSTLEGSDAESFADDLYDYCEFGYGADKDGVMLLISMEERDWYITTCGYGIIAFTDEGIQYIRKHMIEDLSDGNYAKALNIFAEDCDEFITKARSGKPFDKSNLPRDPMSPVWIPISLLIGWVFALIIVGGMKSELKSVRFQPMAKDYVKNGSLNITQSRDLFLYRTISRTEKPKDSGSSTHTSSSGRTHGGGGGKF